MAHHGRKMIPFSCRWALSRSTASGTAPPGRCRSTDRSVVMVSPAQIVSIQSGWTAVLMT
jgi:hypothetical protein